MPKLRDTADLDVDALEAVEYSTERYSDYAGEIPPIGLELSGYVKKIWWTRSANDDPMLKVLWIADGNEGDLEEYNGCPFWLNAALIPGAKFRWDPFLLAYGLTLLEVKTKTYVAKEEDSKGFIIERIGTWKPGADRDEAWCRIITGQEPYNGSIQAIAEEWLPWDYEGDDEEPDDVEDEADPDEDDPDEDEPEDEEPDEDEPDEDEDEPDEAPAVTPARARRASGRAAGAARSAQPARTARTAAKPANAKTGTRTRASAAKAAPARTARASATSSRAAKTPARSTRTKRRAADNEPPF